MCHMKLSLWLNEKYGRGKALSTAIGVPQSFVVKMAQGEKQVPAERCVPIERATGGAVTRKDLRPDDWQSIWPEAAANDWMPATPPPTTEPAAAAMVPLLQSGLEKAEQALADEPTDRVARLVQRNRAQALAEIATPLQPTTEPAAAGV